MLIVLSDLFAAAGSSSGEQLCKYLPLLAERRAGDNFPFVNQLDYAVGKAIRVFGPAAVLTAIPHGITGDDGETLDFPRSWLLPVLRENVQRTQLAYFVENFLPLSEKLRDAANRCINRSNDVGKKMYQLLENQVFFLHKL